MLTVLYLSSYCSVQQRLLQFRSDPPSLNSRLLLLSQRIGNSPLWWQPVARAAFKPSILWWCFFLLDLDIDFLFLTRAPTHTNHQPWMRCNGNMSPTVNIVEKSSLLLKYMTVD